MKKIIKKFKELPLSKKIQISVAVLMTMAFITAIPVYAWFTNQKKAAEMFKVKYPNALYINAAHREDRINFELDGIDVDNTYAERPDGSLLTDGDGKPIKKTKKYYIFSVSGSNANGYILQMAHTNNNLFNYKIYDATQYDYLTGADAPDDTPTDKIVPSGTDTERIIPYTLHADSHNENTIQVVGDEYVDGETSTKYYVRAENTVSSGEYKNVSGNKSYPANTGNKYYTKTYGSNTNVDTYSVPSYWQARVTLQNTEIDGNKQFCKYYILEVSWGSEQDTQEDKETDMIYFSVERTNG